MIPTEEFNQAIQAFEARDEEGRSFFLFAKIFITQAAKPKAYSY